jgi:hypothetical protein
LSPFLDFRHGDQHLRPMLGQAARSRGQFVALETPTAQASRTCAGLYNRLILWGIQRYSRHVCGGLEQAAMWPKRGAAGISTSSRTAGMLTGVAEGRPNTRRFHLPTEISSQSATKSPKTLATAHFAIRPRTMPAVRIRNPIKSACSTDSRPEPIIQPAFLEVCRTNNSEFLPDHIATIMATTHYDLVSNTSNYWIVLTFPARPVKSVLDAADQWRIIEHIRSPAACFCREKLGQHSAEAHRALVLLRPFTRLTC